MNINTLTDRYRLGMKYIKFISLSLFFCASFIVSPESEAAPSPQSPDVPDWRLSIEKHDGTIIQGNLNLTLRDGRLAGDGRSRIYIGVFKHAEYSFTQKENSGNLYRLPESIRNNNRRDMNETELKFTIILTDEISSVNDAPVFRALSPVSGGPISVSDLSFLSSINGSNPDPVKSRWLADPSPSRVASHLLLLCRGECPLYSSAELTRILEKESSLASRAVIAQAAPQATVTRLISIYFQEKINSNINYRSVEYRSVTNNILNYIDSIRIGNVDVNKGDMQWSADNKLQINNFLDSHNVNDYCSAVIRGYKVPEYNCRIDNDAVIFKIIPKKYTLILKRGEENVNPFNYIGGNGYMIRTEDNRSFEGTMVKPASGKSIIFDGIQSKGSCELQMPEFTGKKFRCTVNEEASEIYVDINQTVIPIVSRPDYLASTASTNPQTTGNGKAAMPAAPKDIEVHVQEISDGAPTDVDRNILRPGKCTLDGAKITAPSPETGILVLKNVKSLDNRIVECKFAGYRTLTINESNFTGSEWNAVLRKNVVNARIIDAASQLPISSSNYRLISAKLTLPNGDHIKGSAAGETIKFENVPDVAYGKELPCEINLQQYQQNGPKFCRIDDSGNADIFVSLIPSLPRVRLSFDGRDLGAFCEDPVLDSDGDGYFVKLNSGNAGWCRDETVRLKGAGQTEIYAHWQRPLLIVFVHVGQAFKEAIAQDDPSASLFWPRMLRVIESIRELPLSGGGTETHLASYLYQGRDDKLRLLNKVSNPGHFFFESPVERATSIDALRVPDAAIALDITGPLSKVSSILGQYTFPQDMPVKANVLIIRGNTTDNCAAVDAMATKARGTGIRLQFLEFGNAAVRKKDVDMKSRGLDVYSCSKGPLLAVDAAAAGDRDQWEGLSKRLPGLISEYFSNN